LKTVDVEDARLRISSRSSAAARMARISSGRKARRFFFGVVRGSFFHFTSGS